jgi:hypothetical protein
MSTSYCKSVASSKSFELVRLTPALKSCIMKPIWIMIFSVGSLPIELHDATDTIAARRRASAQALPLGGARAYALT